jgi:predicted negative regulator of RcsB-dependent stress response
MENSETILYFIILLFVIGLGIFFIKKLKKETEISIFFEKYTNELSEEDTTAKINEIANVNSQYPANDKKIAQALLRFYNKLNEKLK